MMRFFPLAVLCVMLSTSTRAQSAVPTVTLSWQAVTVMSDGTPLPQGAAVTYNIYGGHALTGPFAVAGNVSTVSSVRSNVAVGLDCYQVTAVVNTIESVPTPVICVTVAASTTPATPLNLVATQTQ